MKKVFLFFLILVFIGWAYVRIDKTNLTDFSSLYLFSACEKPIAYRIGTVDPRFNLTREELLNDSKHAASVWNNTQPHNVIIYDPNAMLSINFTYDERQALNNKINQLQNQVSEQKNTLKPEISSYESKVADFNRRVADLNSNINYWNEKGGAPEEEYKKLISGQEELKKEAEELNQLAKSLNRSTESYNAQIGKLNQTVNTFKEAIESRPEEGIFDSQENRIDIYFNISRNELIHTLAHEMGHALGIGHVNDPKAIMYAMSTDWTVISKDDIDEINYVCRKISFPELFYERLVILKSLARNFYNSTGFY